MSEIATMERRPGRPRKVVPQVEVIQSATVDFDDREGTMKWARKQLGDAAKGMSLFYGSQQDSEKGVYKRRGAVPVVIDGKQLDHKGDPLWMEDENRSKSRVRNAGLEARRIVEDSLAGPDPSHPEVAREGGPLGKE